MFTWTCLTPDRTASEPIREQHRWTQALRSGAAPFTCGVDFIGHISVVDQSLTDFDQPGLMT